LRGALFQKLQLGGRLMAKVGARGRGSNTATSSSAVFAPMISLPKGGNAIGVAAAVMGYTSVAFVRLGEVYQRALLGLVFVDDGAPLLAAGLADQPAEFT
jgi:hypothetical protein